MTLTEYVLLRAQMATIQMKPKENVFNVIVSARPALTRQYSVRLVLIELIKSLRAPSVLLDALMAIQQIISSNSVCVATLTAPLVAEQAKISA